MTERFDDLDLSAEELATVESLRNALGRVAQTSPAHVPPFEELVADRADATVVPLQRATARRWARVTAIAAACLLVVGVGALIGGRGDDKTDLALDSSTPTPSADLAQKAAPEPEVLAAEEDVAAGQAPAPVAAGPDATAGADANVATDALDPAAEAANAADAADAAVASGGEATAVLAPRAPTTTLPPASQQRTTAAPPSTVSTAKASTASTVASKGGSASANSSQQAISPQLAPALAPAGAPAYTDGSPYGITYSRGAGTASISFTQVRLPNDTDNSKGGFPAAVLANLPAGAAATSSLNGLLRSDLERFANELSADQNVEAINGTIGRVTMSDSLVVVERAYSVQRKNTTPAIDAWPGALVVDTKTARIVEAREMFTAAALEEMAARLATAVANDYPSSRVKTNAQDVVRTMFRAVASDNRACCAVAPRSDGVYVAIDGSYVLNDPQGEIASTVVPWAALDGLISATSPVADRLANAETVGP